LQGYIEQRGIKLHKGPKRTGPNLDDAQAREVYKQGERDAQKIDVKRKRIKNVDED